MGGETQTEQGERREQRYTLRLRGSPELDEVGPDEGGTEEGEHQLGDARVGGHGPPPDLGQHSLHSGSSVRVGGRGLASTHSNLISTLTNPMTVDQLTVQSIIDSYNI